MNITWPTMHHDKKRSTKLSLKEISEIRNNFPNNPDYNIFAEKYNVTQRTIRYWVDDDFRIQCINLSNKHQKDKIVNDPEYAKYIYLLQKKSHIYNYKKYSEIREYHKKYIQQPEIHERIKNNTNLRNRKSRIKFEAQHKLSNFDTFSIYTHVKYIPEGFKKCRGCQVWIASKDIFCPFCRRKLVFRKEK